MEANKQLDASASLGLEKKSCIRHRLWCCVGLRAVLFCRGEKHFLGQLLGNRALLIRKSILIKELDCLAVGLAGVFLQVSTRAAPRPTQPPNV
jgi:hypothetical protein